jgi:hypothetical protein
VSNSPPGSASHSYVVQILGSLGAECFRCRALGDSCAGEPLRRGSHLRRWSMHGGEADPSG